MVQTITRLNPPTLPDAASVGYSQISVVEPGRLAFISGQVAWQHNGAATPATLSGQTALVIANLAAALQALAATPHDIAQLRIYMTDLQADTQQTVMEQVLGFLDGAKPSVTGVGVTALAAPDLQVEIEMVVRLPN